MKVGRHKNSPAAFRRRAYKRGKQLELFAKGIKKSTSALPVLSIHFYMLHFTTNAEWPQGVFRVSLQCLSGVFRVSS